MIDDVLSPDFQELERESFTFFNWFRQHLSSEYPHVTFKPVSIHDLAGKYSPVGYQAARVGIMDPANSANAEFSVLPGDYRTSVEEGIVETVGYLRDQIAQCPDQNIIVGGYSQGAQVMGDALFRLTAAERTKILGASFFGDPKFVGAEDASPLNPLSNPSSYAWKRGDALASDSGMLEGRVPYVPADMANKTVSYCHRIDFICSGWSGFRGLKATAHESYGEEPMRSTVKELLGWAAPYLAAAERARGGFGDGQAAPSGDNKQRDIMFMLNDSSINNVITTMRNYLDPYLDPVAKKYPNTAYAAKGFRESYSHPADIPRVDEIQTSFLPYSGYSPNDWFSRSNLQQSFISRYYSGQPFLGSGDQADPHGVAIERGVFDPGWRTGSEKHLVLITDRPVKENYAYNICNATVRSGMHIPNIDGYSACYSNFGHDIWPTAGHSEVCETIYLAITQDQCKNPLQQPGYSQMISRTLNDAIIAAQARGVVVDIVVPYKITDPYNQFGVDKMMSTLRNVATSTGGVFVYYDKRTNFDGASLSDMMYQIFGNKPQQLAITYKEALDGQLTFRPGPALLAHTNQPVVINAASTGVSYPFYKWDFNDDGIWDQQTAGPTAQHTFTGTDQRFLRVAGLSASGEIAVESRIALALTVGQPPAQPKSPAVPAFSAATNANGSITLSWQSDEQGDLIVIDPDTNLPLLSVDLTAGSLTLESDSAYEQLLVRVAGEQAISDSQPVSVQPYIAPASIVSVQQQTQSAAVTQQAVVATAVTAEPRPAVVTNESTDTPSVAGLQQTAPKVDPTAISTTASDKPRGSFSPFIILAALVALPAAYVASRLVSRRG